MADPFAWLAATFGIPIAAVGWVVVFALGALLAVALSTGLVGAGSGHLGRRAVFLLVLLAVLLLGLLGAAGLWYGTQQTAAVAAAAATLAAVQWLAQQRLALRLHRKQHTLKLILDIRQSADFQAHRARIFHHRAHTEPVTAADVAALLAERTVAARYAPSPPGVPQGPVIESYIHILNINEFIAASVRQGDLDTELVRESIGGLLEGYYRKAMLLIADRHYADPTRRAFEHYIALMAAWGLPRPPVPANAVRAAWRGWFGG
jgi:hypothetical protein